MREFLLRQAKRVAPLDDVLRQDPPQLHRSKSAILLSILPRSILYKTTGYVPLSQAQEPYFSQARDLRTKALEGMYRRHRAWLMTFLARRFGTLVSEDLAQEAFARTLASGADLRNPRAFLAKVAIRAAMEEVRRRPELRFVYEPAVAVLPEAEVAVLLEQTIATLPEPIRDVFVLSRFGGLSNVEIAQRCNLSVKRVEARLTEARRRCAALMQD